jgi:hypothetical protein
VPFETQRPFRVKRLWGRICLHARSAPSPARFGRPSSPRDPSGRAWSSAQKISKVRWRVLRSYLIVIGLRRVRHDRFSYFGLSSERSEGFQMLGEEIRRRKVALLRDDRLFERPESRTIIMML